MTIKEEKFERMKHAAVNSAVGKINVTKEKSYASKAIESKLLPVVLGSSETINTSS